MTGDQLQLNLVTCPHCGEQIDLAAVSQVLTASEEPDAEYKQAVKEANKRRKVAWKEYLTFVGPDWKLKLKAAVEAENDYIELVSHDRSQVVL